MTLIRTLAATFAAATLLLSGCGGSSSSGNSDLGNSGGGNSPGTGDPVPARAFDMSLTSPAPRADGGGDVTVTFTVFIPERRTGETRPLIVHSHGFGGSRVGIDEANADPAAPADISSTTSVFSRIDDQVRLLWDAGYIVVSFDERGFGRGDDGDDGNSGAIQTLDPDFEIRDAIAVLDWADANIPAIQRDGRGNMIAGAIGGSYGGGYQLLLAALDDRLDAITPTATWYNLQQSLVPNNVIKKAYSTGLCLLILTDGAEAGRRNQNACDQASDLGAPTARYLEDIPQDQPMAGNRAELIEAFFGHGLSAFENREQTVGDFSLRPIDALLIQGNRDILFNFNQAAENFRYLSQAGGDVRLLTMENGHSIMQTRMNPGSQGPLGTSACGRLDALAAIRAWFDLKLRGQSGAAADLPGRVCISLDNSSGVLLNSIPSASPAFTVTIPETAVTAAASNILDPADGIFIPGPTITGNNQVLAGVPVANLAITDADPLAAVNNGTAAFVGTGIMRGGDAMLVDDQVQPLRAQNPMPAGATPLVGVGEQLQDGDVVGVLIYGNFDQYETGTGSVPINFGLNNRFTLSGSVRLPIVTATTQSR